MLKNIHQWFDSKDFETLNKNLLQNPHGGGTIRLWGSTAWRILLLNSELQQSKSVWHHMSCHLFYFWPFYFTDSWRVLHINTSERQGDQTQEKTRVKSQEIFLSSFCCLFTAVSWCLIANKYSLCGVEKARLVALQSHGFVSLAFSNHEFVGDVMLVN